MDEGVPGPIVRWMASFLEGRRARVRVEVCRISWTLINQRHNSPQDVTEALQKQKPIDNTMDPISVWYNNSFIA